MAFLPMDTDNDDVPRRTDEGERNIALSENDWPEYHIRPEGCRDCAFRAHHNVTQWLAQTVPFGTHRNSTIPADQEITVDKLNRIQQGYFAAHMAIHSYPINQTFNAGSGGTGNNTTVEFGYKIVSSSGNQITLEGPNPRRVKINNRRVNTSWPFPDPITGETSRLVNDESFVSIPAGAIIEFLPPSVLASKLRPVIKKITEPSSEAEETTFTVTLTCDVSNATEPIDLSLSPEEYRCKIHWEHIYPMHFLNLQEYDETQFTIFNAEFTDDVVVTLRDTERNNCRVLYPDMQTINTERLPDGPMRVELWENGNVTVLTQSQMLDRIETIQTGLDAWETTFDLNGLSFQRAKITYCPEATSRDKYRVPYVGMCANCQVDHSGSYSRDGDRHCTNVETADELSNFTRRCWQPECAGFGLKCKSGGTYGSLKTPPDSLDDAAFWSSLYHRSNWLIRQSEVGISNSRNFNYIKPGNAGPSLSTIAGAFVDNAPGDLQTTTTDEQVGPMGNLISYTDSGGDAVITVLNGAWYQKGNDFSGDGGPDERSTVGSPTAGFLAESDSSTNRIGYMLENNDVVYNGNTNVGSSFGSSGAGMAYSPAVWSNSETWAIAVELTINDDLNDEIQDLLNGIT